MNKDKIIQLIVWCAESWWLFGIVGWILIISNYPIGITIPRYAG